MFHVVFGGGVSNPPGPDPRGKAHVCGSVGWYRTCAGAHAPGGQPVRRGEAVEHAHVLRRQELHKLGVVEHFSLAVQDGRRLFRDVNNLPRDEGDGDGKNILMAQRSKAKVTDEFLIADVGLACKSTVCLHSGPLLQRDLQCF